MTAANESIGRLAASIADQRSNVVLSFAANRLVVRHGNLELKEADGGLLDGLGRLGGEELLLPVRDGFPTERLRAAFSESLHHDRPLAESLHSNGVEALAKFKKVLLVAPWGDHSGSDLRLVAPQLGLEMLSAFLRRAPQDVDARVFNPNLADGSRLRSLVAQERIDLFGFTLSPPTMPRDFEILDRLALAHPTALFVAGGFAVSRMPCERFAGIVPLDILIVRGPEGALLRILERLEPAADKGKEVVERFADVPNLVLLSEGRATMTASETGELPVVSISPSQVAADIAYDRPDLVHGKSYTTRSRELHGEHLPYDAIGRRRLYVLVSDRCRGKCVFCSAPRERLLPRDPEVVLEEISRQVEDFDGVHFSDNDLLVDPDLLERLCEGFERAGLRAVPKSAKARTDEIDPPILARLRAAGFRILTFGVESFDDRVLREMGKGVTSQQNATAIRLTLEAGIKPGINLICFSPWETEASLLSTAFASLRFAEMGAYLNAMAEMHTQLGDRFSGSEENRGRVEWEKLAFRSTGASFLRPRRVRLDAQMEEARRRTLVEQASICKEIHARTGYVSQAVSSLALMQGYSRYMAAKLGSGMNEDLVHLEHRYRRCIDRTLEWERQGVILEPSGTLSTGE